MPGQKVHTFQRSVEAVMLRLADAEKGQISLGKMSALNQTTDIQVFRNQLKVRPVVSHYIHTVFLCGSCMLEIQSLATWEEGELTHPL